MTLGVITVNTVLRALVFQAETLKYMYDICGLIKSDTSGRGEQVTEVTRWW